MMRAVLNPAVLAVAAVACGSLFGCSGSEDSACDQSIVGNVCTIAGNTENGYDGDDGPALEALLSLPQDTLTASDGTVYLLDWNNHRIRKIEDGIIRHVAGRGELGGTNGNPLDDPANSDFNHPTGMLFTPGEDRMVVSAWHNSKIRTLDLATNEIIDTCGDGRRAYFGDNGPALTASLDLPSSIAWDPQQNLVIMDQANQVIRVIDGNQNIQTLYGRCVIDAAPPSGPGPCEDTTACPAVGPNVSGKLTCGEPAMTCASACTPGYNGDDIPAVDMRIGQPFGQSADPGGRILFDPQGRLYFADSANSIIRRIDTDGVVRRIAGVAPINGAPQRGYSGDGGPATSAMLNNPVDLALAEDGTLYFTDVYNHCVRAIDADGNIRTVVGTCGQSGYTGDGPAASTLLKRPYGLELIPGALLISDTGNNIIRSLKL